MMRFLLFILPLLTLACQTPSPDADSVPTEETEPTAVDGFHLIPQNQGHYENGLLHGQTLKQEIKAQLTSWQDAMASNLELSTDSLIFLATEGTGFLNAIETYTPQYLTELKGMAEGAEVDWKLLLAFNIGEEIYNYCRRPIESCSNVAFTNERQVMLAYNQDLPEFLHGDQQPVILKSDSRATFAFPGSIGISGASKHLAVSCNSLPMLNMNPNGLPLSFALRALLDAESLEAGINFLQDVQLAIPQNLMMVDPSQMIGVEFAKAGLIPCPKDENGYLLHTNFPLENNDVKDQAYEPEYCDRYAYLDSVTALHSNPDLNSLKVMMAQPPITNAETYLRFVVAFNRKTETLDHLEIINPANTDYTHQIRF